MSIEREVARLRRKAAEFGGVGAEAPPVVIPEGGIIEFATSPEFIGVELFPLQATVLKIITLALHLFTPFDLDEIERWTAGFCSNEDLDQPAYQGRKGTTPDLLERIKHCLDSGRSVFGEVVLVIGRRGSKSYLAAIVVVWHLWSILALGDPQRHYGIPSNKKLTIHLFAADQVTLVRNAFGDVVNLLQAPCFKPFLGKATTTMVSLLTPAQLAKGARPGTDLGNVQVVAAPTTSTAIRGPTVPLAWMDEFGHVNGAGSTASSTEIYIAATPTLDQFPVDGLIIQTSTPREKLGQFYASYSKACKIDPITCRPLAPATAMLQLPSDELYLYADIAHEIEMWPGGPFFPSGLVPKITRRDIENRRLWDPLGAEIENEAQFAAAVNAYLLPDRIANGFGMYKGIRLTHQTNGRPGITYVAHVDPGKTESNFGISIGHLEWEQGLPNVITDYIHAWTQQDFEETIDYVMITEELLRLLVNFPLNIMVFDQFNSIYSIQKLRAEALRMNLDWRPHIYERTATAALNWKSAEVFKMALHLGLFHAPPHELAQSELEHLVVVGQKVSAPTTGDVKTDDLADCLIGMTYTLLHEHLDVFNDLSRIRLSASLPGGLPIGSSLPTDPISQLRALTKGRAPGRSQPYNPARGFRRSR